MPSSPAVIFTPSEYLISGASPSKLLIQHHPAYHAMALQHRSAFRAQVVDAGYVDHQSVGGDVVVEHEVPGLFDEVLFPPFPIAVVALHGSTRPTYSASERIIDRRPLRVAVRVSLSRFCVDTFLRLAAYMGEGQSCLMCIRLGLIGGVCESPLCSPCQVINKALSSAMNHDQGNLRFHRQRLRLHMSKSRKVSTADIEKELKAFIRDRFLSGNKNIALDAHDSFLERGLIDSTGVLELVGFIEETYHIKVEDEDLIPDNLDSLDKLEKFISRKLRHVGR